ncbi:cellulose biosynthesis protein BcsE [Pseudoalteromonas sp.]|uniref:cellulose biosynthesis protein BcsE n=2 Tax=Pseudoalteromonas TaxID=53246 RepID=UPI003F98F41C
MKKKLHFIRGLLAELKVYDELFGSTVILHINTDLITPYNHNELIEQLKLYESFTRRYQLTFIFIATGLEVVRARMLMRGLNKSFDGIVYVSNESTVKALEYDYWSHSEGVIAGETVLLEASNNKFKVSEGSSTEAKTLKFNRDFDENDVWLVRNVVPEGTKLPVSYKLLEDNEALYQHASEMKAATLVFSVTRYTDLADLAKQCFSLRKLCGKKLKLVIQNVDGIIRHQDERLFLTLGVNLILYSFSEPSRLLSQIQSIQGFEFSRPLPSSIEEVLHHSQSQLSKGFLPLLDFARQVINYSSSAANLGISGVMVTFRLLPRIDAIHPLQLFHVKREGDVFSTVDEYVYLYLHACREHDVDNAIRHLFKLEIADFFDSKTVIAEHFFIQQECRRLKKAYKDREIPDYTDKLKDNSSYTYSQESIDLTSLAIESPEFNRVKRPDAQRFPMTLNESKL